MAFYSDRAFSESVSAITATSLIQLGERRVENGREFVHVYNNGTTANVGYIVVMTALSGYSVTVTSALGSRLFGVVQNTNLTTNYYGWVLTKGVAYSTVPDGLTVTATAGFPLQVAAEGTHQPVTTGATGSTFATRGLFGYALQDIATAGTGAAYIQIGG